MSWLQPEEAPEVHIQQIPINSKAVEVKPFKLINNNYNGPALRINVWTESNSIPASRVQDYDNFIENNCENCRYYTDEMEYSAYDHEVDTEDGRLALRGSFYTESPCPAYNSGLDDVSFPCEQGCAGPDDDVDCDDLDAEFMKFGIVYKLQYFGWLIYENYASLQAVDIADNGDVWVGEEYKAINTFDAFNICWGGNSEPNSLLESESIYITSKANEDLLTFASHQDNHGYCAGESGILEDEGEILPHAVPVPAGDHRGKAVVVATPGPMTSAYLIMTASGAYTNDGTVFVPVMFYKDVKVDEDVVMNVWASDVLKTGKRLLFMDHFNPENPIDAHNGRFLGQVDKSFDLTPWKSLVAQ